MASIESRYTNQIKDLQDNFSNQISTLNIKIKSLEKELRSAREDLELERRGRSANSGSTEKRIQELQDNEFKLTAELEQVKKIYEEAQ